MPEQVSNPDQSNSTTRRRVATAMVAGGMAAGLLAGCSHATQAESSLACDTVTVGATPETTGGAIDELLQKLPGEQSGVITTKLQNLIGAQPEGTELIGCIEDGKTVGIAKVDADGDVSNVVYKFNNNGDYSVDKVSMPANWPASKS